MAFNLNNLLSTLDSSIGLLDSSSDLLSILQAINVTNPTMGHGKSQKKTYATRASLPAASVSLRGSLATVETVGNWQAPEDPDNGLYVCTGNDWALVQGLDSAGTPPPFQGSNYGYASGGTDGSSASNVIDKFPFAADFTGTATDVGDLIVGRYNVAGQSSSTHGYSSGGSSPTTSDVIDKFSFTTDGDATDVGNLTVARYKSAGQSSIGNGFGYTTASEGTPSVTFNVIDKFSFSTDGDATDVGDMSVHRSSAAGQSSTTHGYASGGNPGNSNVIDKFSFTTDGDATDVGDLSLGRQSLTGQSSTTHGYSSGGYTTGRIDIIDKFPFASDDNATDVGNLTAGKNANSGQSSTAHGYSSGGYGPALSNVIEKFPFASDDNATDAGDLSVARYASAGQQY